MHIQDFHSKFASMNEGGHLFEALRSLSRIEHPKAMFDGENEVIFGEWIPWPPMDAHAACGDPTLA